MKRFRAPSVAVALLLSLSFASPAWATYSCTGTAAQCKAFLSVLLAAQASGRSIQLAFNDSLTCTTHDPWALLTGWYYGPVLLSN